jgi:hypothetical protein
MQTKQTTTQTATITATDAEHWKSTKGQAQILAFLLDGWTVSLSGGKSLTRVKSIAIPTL